VFRYVGRDPFRLAPSPSQRAILKAFPRCFWSFRWMVHFVRPWEASPGLDIQRASGAKSSKGFSGPHGPVKADAFGFMCEFDKGAPTRGNLGTIMIRPGHPYSVRTDQPAHATCPHRKKKKKSSRTLLHTHGHYCHVHRSTPLAPHRLHLQPSLPFLSLTLFRHGPKHGRLRALHTVGPATPQPCSVAPQQGGCWPTSHASAPTLPRCSFH
jgi:hypothetical protein